MSSTAPIPPITGTVALALIDGCAEIVTEPS